MAPSVQFLDLPVEILYHHIIPQLDPVSLIALAQTCKRTRGIISPEHHDFVERLLRLELLPKYGGVVPRFRGRDNKLTPPLDDWPGFGWKDNKYACTGCMKLLPHMMFIDHDIMRLDLRKPPLESTEATKATDWRPFSSKDVPVIERHRRIVRKKAEQQKVLRPWKERYHLAVTNQLNPEDELPPPSPSLPVADIPLFPNRARVPPVPFYFGQNGPYSWRYMSPMTIQPNPIELGPTPLLALQAQLVALCRQHGVGPQGVVADSLPPTVLYVPLNDAAALEAELYLCGTERQKRRCLECRFRRGDWSRYGGHPGRLSVIDLQTGTRRRRGSVPRVVPIVRTRRVYLPSPLERVFPGFWDTVPYKQQPNLMLVMRVAGRTHPFNLYNVRCVAGCGRWVELAGFVNVGGETHHDFRYASSMLRDMDAQEASQSFICNHCVLKASSSDPTERTKARLVLGEDLRARMERFTVGARTDTLTRFLWGWDLLREDFQKGELKRHRQWERRIFDGFNKELLGWRNGWSTFGETAKHLPAIVDANLDDLRRRFKIFAHDFWRDSGDVRAHEASTIMQSWFEIWFNEYNKNEEVYLRENQIVKLLQQDKLLPHLLVNYALEQDPWTVGGTFH